MSQRYEPIPSREATTAQQLSALLAISRTLEPWLLESPAEIGTAPAKLDGGAAAAALATFVKTCDAIDKMLDDPSRWTLGKQDELYDSVIETQKCQQALIKAQTASAAEIQRPSFQLKPTVMVFQDGYLAFWGNPYEVGACIYGRGLTPAAALLDFDAAFDRAPKDQVVMIVESQKQSTVEPKPKRRRKE